MDTERKIQAEEQEYIERDTPAAQAEPEISFGQPGREHDNREVSSGQPEDQEREQVPLEELFRELDGILEGMEEEDISLEDAFALYEKGIKTIRRCNKKLDLVEKKMLLIANDGTTVPFE